MRAMMSSSYIFNENITCLRQGLSTHGEHDASIPSISELNNIETNW
jgi:hypothetical protein